MALLPICPDEVHGPQSSLARFQAIHPVRHAIATPTGSTSFNLLSDIQSDETSFPPSKRKWTSYLGGSSYQIWRNDQAHRDLLNETNQKRLKNHMANGQLSRVQQGNFFFKKGSLKKWVDTPPLGVPTSHKGYQLQIAQTRLPAPWVTGSPESR